MLGKRKRSIIEPDVRATTSSLASSPQVPIQPLTTANLARLNCLQNHAHLTAGTIARKSRVMSRSPTKRNSRSRSPKKATIQQDLLKLKAYGILEPERCRPSELPDEIQALVQSISQRKDPAAPPSARKDKLLDIAHVARQKPESDGIDVLGRHMFFETVLQGGDDELISVARDHNLVRGFMPVAVSGSLPAQLGDLENPRPDLCFGYIRSEEANNLRLHKASAPFSDEQELAYAAKRVQISSHVIIPFLTAQYKSASMGKNIREAEVQSLRDGAAIVQANHELLELAGCCESEQDTDRHPSIAAACHFSASCDMDLARLHIHYRERQGARHVYVAKQVYQCDLQDEEGLAGWRTRMRGILDFAVGDRLAIYKAALARLVLVDGAGPGLDDAASSTFASVSGLQSSSSIMSVPEQDSVSSFRFKRAAVTLAMHNLTPPGSERDVVDDDLTKSRKRARPSADDFSPT